MSGKLVCGIGINDADYTTNKFEYWYDEGKRKRKALWICPYYQKWKSMLERCYSPRCKAKRPTYEGCSVCKEWHLFSNFKAWMEKQDWENKHLDKDLLVPKNRVYSPETCIFLHGSVNTFLTESNSTRGEFPVGVYWYKQADKFQAYCRNPFTNKQDHLGYFTNPEAAHQAWLAQKLEFAKLLSEEQDDHRIATALIERYENYGSGGD